MLKIKWKWIGMGLAAFFIIFAMIPLIFVEMTVPAELRTPDKSSVMGRNSRISNLAIIYDYEKEGRRVAVVQSPIVFIDEARDDGINYFLVVTRGYKTDFASLPWLARLFYSPFDEYAEAAIIHDWLYAIGEPGKKREADLTFFRVMLQDGVSPILARYFYTAVRFNTLFDNGGYGRESEWTNGFYSTYLEDDLPPQCVIDKPQTAYMKASDLDFIETVDGVTTEQLDAVSDFVGAILKGLDPYSADWDYALSRDQCKTFVLGPKMQAYGERQFRNMLASYDEDGQQIVDSMITRSGVISQYFELIERGRAYRPYLEAIMETKYGAPIPEPFWCLNPHDQREALNQVLPNGFQSQPNPWPALTCSSARPKSVPEGNGTLCDTLSAHAFDFWVGDWDFLNVETGEIAYRMKVEKTDGCSIIGYSPDEELNVSHVTYFDRLDIKWKHNWVSTVDVFNLEGEFEGENKLVMTGSAVIPDIEWKIPARASWELVDEGLVQYTLEVQPDGMSEWVVMTNGVFLPVTETVTE